MRQLLVHVPRGQGQKVMERARSYEAMNLFRFEANGPDGPLDAVLVHLSPTEESNPFWMIWRRRSG